MESKKLFVFFSISLVLICSCNSGKEYSDELVKVELNNTKKTLALSSLFEGVDVIPLQGSIGNLIGQVRNIVFTEELIIVFDNLQERLFCFDKSGSYKYSVDAQGDGPMEYVSITDYTINQSMNSIEVYSFKQGKLVGFDLESGEAIYNRRFNYYLREFTWLSTNEYLIYSPDILNNELDGGLIKRGSFIVSSQGDFIRHLDINNKESYTQPMNVLSGYGDYALLVPSYSQNVFEFKSGEFHNDYVLTTPDTEEGFGYAAPLSVSGTKNSKLIEYGIPEGSVKTVLFSDSQKISDFIYFKNDVFNFPIKPQFVDYDGGLIDILSFEKYSYIKQNLGEVQESRFFQSAINENFFTILSDFKESSNPILIKIKTK
ncbi:6-bladed beta-propeller [Roseivirga sp.]|uniref:6-bladed beta-propeller n=1 Tax=Roseivirga sp. TaxID=1964215 RepID=UPI003B8B6E7A